MGVIIFLILFSLIIALAFLYSFFWAVKSGQFDDAQTPAIRMLFDNETSINKNQTLTKRGE